MEIYCTFEAAFYLPWLKCVVFILVFLRSVFAGIAIGSVAGVIVIVVILLMVSVKFRNRAVHQAKEGYVAFCYMMLCPFFSNMMNSNIG